MMMLGGMCFLRRLFVGVRLVVASVMVLRGLVGLRRLLVGLAYRVGVGRAIEGMECSCLVLLWLVCVWCQDSVVLCV